VRPAFSVPETYPWGKTRVDGERSGEKISPSGKRQITRTRTNATQSLRWGCIQELREIPWKNARGESKKICIKTGWNTARMRKGGGQTIAPLRWRWWGDRRIQWAERQENVVVGMDKQRRNESGGGEQRGCVV